jgi:hypothetical protein
MTICLPPTIRQTIIRNEFGRFTVRPLDRITFRHFNGDATMIVGHIAYNAQGNTVLWDEDHTHMLHPEYFPITRVESTI